jgi:hypothetical protein
MTPLNKTPTTQAEFQPPSPLDFAILAGIRAATKAGMPPIALAVHQRDAAEETIGGLPVLIAATLQFDDWETGSKYLPLFGSNNGATLEAEKAFMEAVCQNQSKS